MIYEQKLIFSFIDDNTIRGLKDKMFVIRALCFNGPVSVKVLYRLMFDTG